jgi:hypothetical protein
MGSRAWRSTSLTSGRYQRCAIAVRKKHGLRTSFCDLRKCQAGTPLQVNVIGVDKGAQSPQRLAGEEVGVGSLSDEVY